MKSQPNSPICSSTPPIHRRHRRPPATARAAATAAHPRISPSLTVTRSLQRRLSPWPCGLTNLLKHATDPPPPCAPPPAYLCTCCRPRLRARRHLCLCACRRLQLFPLYLSLSLSISLPLSTLKSRVWRHFSCLGRPSDAYPAKSMPWRFGRTPYRFQPRRCRRPRSPAPRRLGVA
jgi:hypothetical protein